MSLAARVAGWQRKLGGQAGPYSGASASGESSNELVMVEILVDGIWTDITSFVMVRESGNISIQRGVTSEGATPDPGRCSLQLNNRDGRFSLNNPLSPYYGKIGRNTQLRVSVPKGDDKAYRFWGEVPDWPEDWDFTDTDRSVSISAAGILRRLRQGSTPLRGTLYRGITSSATPAPIAYWPCEDGSTATSLASALPGGTPMSLIGTPTLASDSGFPCSGDLPVMNGGSLFGTIPPYTLTGETQIRFLMFLPTPPADGTQLIKVAASGSTVSFWAVTYATGGSLNIKGLASDGLTSIVSAGPFGFNVDDQRIYVTLDLTQNGTGVDYLLGTANINGTAGQVTGNFASTTAGKMTSVTVTPGRTITDGVFGHVSIQLDATGTIDLANQVSAYNGEEVDARLFRLSKEEGINYVTENTNSHDTMGPQRPDTFLNLVQECIDVDQGTFFEREVALGIVYLPRRGMYNTKSQLALSYTDGNLSDVPRPMPDSKLVQNSVSASRPTGSSALAQQLTGSLSINPPPAGVGPYPDAPVLNLELDSDLPYHASWRVHLGTVDEPRYPAISINLARSGMAALRLQALFVLFGDRITVSGVPSRLGGDLSLIVIGIQETLTLFEHRITYVCVPASPYRVVQLDSSAFGHLSPDGSTLGADAGPADTTLSVSSPSTTLWTTAAGDFPFDILIGGEQITVTNITGASSPQSFTVTRAVNGISKPHALGESIDLNSPVFVAL